MSDYYSMSNVDLVHGGDSRTSDVKSEKFKNLKKLAGEEKVDHPSHYNRPNSMECIDEMELVFGREAVMNFCLLNVWKYRYRAADKNGEEDLKKSDWYLNKFRELLAKEPLHFEPESKKIDWEQYKYSTGTPINPNIVLCGQK